MATPTDHDPQAFGTWVRQVREIYGYDQQQLAAAVGMHPSRLCRIERGKKKKRCPRLLTFLLTLQTHPPPLPGVIREARRLRVEARRLLAWHAVVAQQVAQRASETALLRQRLLGQHSAAD